MPITGVNVPRLGQRQFVVLPWRTTAAAEDVDVLVLYARDRAIKVYSAYIMFVSLDTYSAGDLFALETDNGTTETQVASYATTAGTALRTIYPLDFTAPCVAAPGSWVQLRVDHNEDAASVFSLLVEYAEV